MDTPTRASFMTGKYPLRLGKMLDMNFNLCCPGNPSILGKTKTTSSGFLTLRNLPTNLEEKDELNSKQGIMVYKSLKFPDYKAF